MSKIQLIRDDKSIVVKIVRLVSIVAALYVAIVFWLAWQETSSVFSKLGLETLIAGAILSSAAYFIRFARWEYALNYIGHVVPKLEHFLIYLSGLALTMTPGKAGETFRSAFLLRYQVPVPKSLAVFLADRASDVLGVCLLGFFSSLMIDQSHSWLWVLGFLVLILGSTAFSFVISFSSKNTSRRQYLSRFCNFLPLKIGKATLENWAEIWCLKQVLLFTALAMIAYGIQSIVFYWFCEKVGADIQIFDCMLVFVQATLFGASTMIPGGLGAMEAAIVIQLIDRGVSNGTAISLAIAIRLVTLWIGMLLGVISLLIIARKEFSSGKIPDDSTS